MRSEDLNNIVHYLDEQTDLPVPRWREWAFLYGLDLEWIPAEEETLAKIRISKGIGLSSMGYLFDIGETEFTSYSRNSRWILTTFLCEDDIELLRGDEPPITLWELSDKTGKILWVNCSWILLSILMNLSSCYSGSIPGNEGNLF
ncbi:MAG: hypothetical protein R3B93_07940 [Bacteroidia bacterium]